VIVTVVPPCVDPFAGTIAVTVGAAVVELEGDAGVLPLPQLELQMATMHTNESNRRSISK
jgi:hypothetical protein